jgi:hypothetical protein
MPVVEPDRNPRPLQTRPENVAPLRLSLALTRDEVRAKTFSRAKTPETRAAAVHAYGNGVTRGFSASDGRQRGAELTSPWGSKTAWTSGQVFIRGDASENQKSRDGGGGEDDAGWSDDDSSTTTVDEGDDAVWGKSKGEFRSRVLEKGSRVGGVDMRRVGAASVDGGDGGGDGDGDGDGAASEGGARGRRPTGSFAAQRKAPHRGVHLPSAVELNTPLKVQT